MRRRVIVDAGPLAALLNSGDSHHDWARREWSNIAPPLLTCEAVVSEAGFLGQRAGRGNPADVLEMVRRGILDISFSLSAEIDRVSALMSKYRDVPMSVADACLVRMSELHRGSPVLTLDRDFTIYRRKRRQPIPLLSPGISPPGSISPE